MNCPRRCRTQVAPGPSLERPPEIGEQLGAAVEAELEAWADNVLDAATLDDVFDTGRG